MTANAPNSRHCGLASESYHIAMTSPKLPTYFGLPWPEPDLPAGAPEWMYYEIDEAQDAVSRSIEVFPDGRIERNSIEIEERRGDCPSLIDVSLQEGFEGTEPREMSQDDFEKLWLNGVDTRSGTPVNHPIPLKNSLLK